jgi:GR25 family glycosyltransferase involved in LPS biosynthesis
MKIQDFNAIYINLDKDIYKNNRIIKILSQLKIRYTRQEGINAKNLVDISYRNKVAKLFNVKPELMDVKFWMNRSNFKTMTKYQNAVLGKVGCFLSHILAIKKAIDMNFEKVLILEDDADPLENINQTFNIPEDADIYYLGGSFWTNNVKNPETNNIKIDCNLFKVGGTFAYIIPNREKMIEIYNVFISVFNKGKSRDKHPEWRAGKIKLRAQSADLAYINHYQKNGNCYIINPVRISHKELGSNIKNNRKRYKISHFLTKKQKNTIKPLFDSI